jgi:hypothetical protein
MRNEAPDNASARITSLRMSWHERTKGKKKAPLRSPQLQP